MSEKLDSIVENLDVIRQLYGTDVIASVLDAQGIVQGVALPPGVPAQQGVGDTFEDPTGAFAKAIQTGEVIHNYLPKEVMGFPVEGNLVPIKENGQVVGCLIASYSVADKENMQELTVKFKESVQSVNDSIQKVIEGLSGLFQMLTDMNQMTADVESDVNGAANVVNKIRSNASHSNILALNASIEAARSGEAGRGFAVVATEMGKLAKDSGSSADEIRNTLDVIVNHLGMITASIKDANDVAKSHMDSINAVQAVLSKSISLAEELEADIEK